MPTKRPINRGAEDAIYVEVPVLNAGYIKLVDYMGNEDSIVGAARVSYAKSVNPDEKERNVKLINFLMKNRHTSPFEQCILTFECKMPIFVAREWVRHRTARLNEVSGRYTQMPYEVYIPVPERVLGQDQINRQGSIGKLSPDIQKAFLASHNKIVSEVFQAYNAALSAGVAKEIARIDLPLSTYTRWVWQMDLHNLLHFLHLRTASNAQWEIRQYANAIAKIVESSYPITWAAFRKFVLNTVTIPVDEYERLKQAEKGEHGGDR